MVPESFEADGYFVVEKLIGQEGVSSLADDFEDQRQRADGAHSLRNVHESPVVQEFAAGPEAFGLAKSILGDEARLVRAIYFDKIPGANWSVPWHQDLTIAALERHEVEGFSPWSRKEGVWHVQPPAEVLEKMVTVRVHLDDCWVDNGPVRVKPGSHLVGKIPKPQVKNWTTPEVDCVGAAGSALVMRPLLLHASWSAKSPSHRRVLHLEYAGCDLPLPLAWYI